MIVAPEGGQAVASTERGTTVAGVLDDVTFRARLGRALARARRLRGLTQKQLGARIGRSEAAVSRWEHGKAPPDAFDVHRLCVVLKAPPELFIDPPLLDPDPVERILRQGG